jgi:hypothetical protein
MDKLLNEFTVNRPIDETWAVLTDVERIEAIKDAAIRFPTLAETPVQARIRESLQEKAKKFIKVWGEMRLLVAAQEADTASYFRQKLAKNH